MSLALIPSLDPAASDGIVIANDGFYPDLDLTAFKAETGQGDVFPPARLVATLQAAMIEINASIIAWRVDQTAPCLAEIPAPGYGGISEKILLYTRAVFCRARAELVRTTRDYDSTDSGHDRAERLGSTADDYQRQSIEALARLTGRPRAVVELI